MELQHNGKNYELLEFKTPLKEETSNIIGVFETKEQCADKLIFIQCFCGETAMNAEEIKQVAWGVIKGENTKKNRVILKKDRAYMELQHNEKKYMLFEFTTPLKTETSDIIGVFETKGHCADDLVFVNYFYGATVMTEEEIKQVAIDYIDNPIK